ncbi:hypothetical protein MMC29_006477 [Sticta canariensis]|nr:hypothetical protein [Sticta canariensis]
MTWGKIRATFKADNALRNGRHDSDRLPVSRGLQRRRTDNPPPADDRPAPVNAHSASYPQDSGEYAQPPPGQNWAPQHNPYPYAGQPGYAPSQGQDHDYGSGYNPQQHHLSRHNTFPTSQGSAFNQNMGHPMAYQEPDSRPQFSPHQDHNSSHYQNSDPYRQYSPTSSSGLGLNQGYSGEPYQDPYPHTNTSPEAYDQGQSDYYGSNPHGQGHSYPRYSQSSFSDPPPLDSFGQATTAPANFPHSHGAPPNYGYNGGGYHSGNDHAGNDHAGNDHAGNDHAGNDHAGNDHAGRYY